LPNTFAAFQADKVAAEAGTPGSSNGRNQSRIRFNLTVLGGEGPAAAVPVNIENVPSYPVPNDVKTAYPNATSKCVTPDRTHNICDGAHVLFNGDIMIASESLSQDAYNAIGDHKYYLQSTLNNFDKHVLPLPQTYIVTKHMYWPVPRGQVSAIPVWHRDFNKPNDPSYQGYETWRDFVAVDPSGKNRPGSRVTVEYLYNVFDPTGKQLGPIKAQNVLVHTMDEFYNHQVTEAEWSSFDEADKAIINAASYWAYNKPFGPGDYLMTIAMHINTKEIPSWAMQSVWWSDRPNARPYADDRPNLRKLNPKGPWKHYLLVDAYGIADSKNKDKLPVATNPYIELVTHPVGTDCNNCHNRAGWPTAKDKYPRASYQNPDCPDLLAKLSPDSKCLKPLTLTDFQWIIPDRALK